MEETRTDIRIALPSKGPLAPDSLKLLGDVGMQVYKPNPRQYEATIPNLPGVSVLFQRAGDIVYSVRDGSVDFGITGWDVVNERCPQNSTVLTLLQELGYGQCSLNVIVPENWESVNHMSDLFEWCISKDRPPRVATKFPQLTRRFFREHNLEDIHLIQAEGTLEIAPTIGYADVIVDLVSTGTTLRDNRLKRIKDGEILSSQACLIANRAAIKTRPEVLQIARHLLEFFVAHLRASENLAIFANIRGFSPDQIAAQIFTKEVIAGLQGPTISPLITQQAESWFAVHLIVRKDQLAQAIIELREIGGSGVVVTPVTYIFEEEPPAYQKMLAALEK
jgi:ATP phosphoribosyltransferase